MMVGGIYSFFFFTDTATTEIYTLSLHDALPISPRGNVPRPPRGDRAAVAADDRVVAQARSEEHTSELQSHVNLVCRLLLEKKYHLERPVLLSCGADLQDTVVQAHIAAADSANRG